MIIFHLNINDILQTYIKLEREVVIIVKRNL